MGNHVDLYSDLVFDAHIGGMFFWDVHTSIKSTLSSSIPGSLVCSGAAFASDAFIVVNSMKRNCTVLRKISESNSV